MRLSPASRFGLVRTDSLFAQMLSLLLIWAMVMSSLPGFASEHPSAEWVSSWDWLAAKAAAKAPEQVRNAVTRAALAPAAQASGGISLFAGFADSSSASANFPTPWDKSPNTVFIGAGAPMNAGALRIDNTSGAPLTIDSVAVDLQRSNAQFNLWGSFTIPTDGSAILTQTQPGNFDTSAFPIVPCGGTLASGETRIPKVTITIAGAPQTFLDTAHVLDTGGFDLSCRGNESLQWRQIGTSGLENPAGRLALTPASSSGNGGSPLTTTAQLTDAGGSPLPNVTVDFTILNGPNAGQTGQNVTDSQGNAQFTYTSSTQGADVIQASVTNASGATIRSSQAVVTWQNAACGPGASPTGTANLIYIGATSGEFNDNVELAALLTDANGATVAGRTLSFTAGSQSLSGTTDASGVARVTLTLSSPPGPLPVSVNFAGDGTLPSLQASSSINIDRDETLIRYTGSTLVSTNSPQTLKALLVDPESSTPIAGKTVVFQIGAATASATTDAHGVASATMALSATQVTGPSAMTVSFAGDNLYKPSQRTLSITIFSPAGFVLWGGNNGGLAIGQRVNFWGSQWESQVINGQYFAANPSFKGWSGSAAPIQACQVNATPSTLTTSCWQVKPGQSFPPGATLPDFIEVVVSTVIVKSGDTVFGNVACGAVVKVDHTPPYGAVPGQPGFGTIAAVDGNCAGIFPQPAVVTATQTQPATVLPNQQITVTATVTNASTATAASGVTLNETLDGLTPATESLGIGTVAPGGSQSGSFQAAVPGVPIRQSSESASDYIQRLSALNGRFFTVSGQVTFTDAHQQNYLPVDVSSQSVLRLPVLTLALSGPATLSPNAPATYMVTATNIGSAPVVSPQINVTLPDGSAHLFIVSTIVPGSSFTQPVSFTPAAITPKGANETTDQYLARLSAADGQIETTNATVNWSDTAGNSYGDVGQQMFSSTLRVPVLSFTAEAPATLLPSQTATLNFNVQNNGGCTAVLSHLSVTNPDNSVTSAQDFPLAPGQSTIEQTTWPVTVVQGHLPGETDAAYLGRLTALNNSALNFLANLGWADPTGANYGPTSEPAQSKEIVPIVTVAITAPATAQAGNSIAYAVTLMNQGSATASPVSLTITLPDGTTQTPAIGPLAPGATFQTNVNFAIPASQAAGTITAQASVLWNDAVPNFYGPLSSAAQTTVTNPQQFNTLVLAPAVAGPDVTGTPQTLTATLKDSTGTPISGATVQFAITGVNPGTGTATTNTSGVAAFSYTGTHNGNDVVQATSGTTVSNQATVSWITPVQNISTSTVFARFFASDGSGAFDTPATATPAFTQSFPTINFNPPAGTVPGNNTGIGVNTRPFIDVTTDLNGNFTGTIIAQGNGLQAGNGSLFTFQAVFEGSFTVASAGDVVLSFFSDDGFIIGIGGGATRVSGAFQNVPPSGKTAFAGFPVIGAFNNATAPVANTVIVHFPAAGSYPYELDYTECCAGQESLTMAVGQANSRGVPPTGSLAISPNAPPSKPAGQTQTFTVQASDASGNVVPNVGVALIINGANQQQLSNTTDATGRATFSYIGQNAGTDSVQAVANISGLGAFSNIVNATWTVPAGGGGGTVTFAQQGWIGGPAFGTVVEGQVPITVASGISLTSGTLKFWPSSNPSDIHVLNGNTTGSGTLGTFDGTTLANGEYTIQLQATASNGTTQLSEILVNVDGENKPGRFTKTITDIRIPVAGMAITVSRTYDSLERGRVEDFGFGWALAVGTQLEVDADNDVTFTFNGRRITFLFKPQAGPFPFPFLLLPRFVPQTGVVGTLTSDGCGVMVNSQGSLLCFPGIDTFQPTTYTYTDPYGRVYVFGADGSMKSVQDLNGNVLTFSPSGITSNSGNINIAFQRDSQSRITQINDLNGSSYVYSYDPAGNLVNVTIPNSATPVIYGYTTDHLLNKEVDPRGGTSNSTYFGDGRLQSVTDPLGNVTQYTYNLAANSTTTTNPDGGTIVETRNSLGKLISYKDPLGRITTFTYDANQNPATRTSPLGKITTYTYDANGNVLTMRDPLGNTMRRTYDNIGRLTSLTDPLGQIKSLTHDNRGNLTGMSDALGQMGSSTYDAKGNRTSLTIPNGSTAQMTYDSFGNPISVIDHGGFASTRQFDNMGRWTGLSDSVHGSMTFGYDAAGHYAQRIDPLGNTLAYTYDGVGNRITEVDARGNSYRHDYDAANNLSRTTYPDGSSISMTYDYAGRTLTKTNESGQVARYVYDKAGQLTSITEANGTASAATVSFVYDAGGRMTSFTNERGNVTVLGYDDADRMTSMRDALGHTTTYAYDADSQMTSVTRPNGAQTKFAFDARSRATTVTNPDGTTQQRNYGALALNSLSDEAGKTTTYTYDALSQIASVTNALGNTTTYTRDAVGNLTAVTDPNGHVTHYQYNAADRLVKKILPDGTFEQYTYDNNGNVISRRLTDGHINQYSYDLRNRLVQISYFDGRVVSFAYTPTGKKQSTTTPAGTTLYAYDSLDRLSSITQPTGEVVGYTFDAADNVTSITTPAGVSKFAYDADNRLTTVTDPLGGVTTYTYDVAGRIVQRALPNGVITQYTYDLLDRLTGMTHSRGASAPFESFQYTLSPTGQRTKVVEVDGSQTNWTYDDTYRLLRETVNTSAGAVLSDTSFTYDPAGNRTSMTANGTTTNYQYNANDQLLTAGTAQYGYDARGNLTSINDTNGTTSYTYDGANRLSSVSLPNVGLAAAYTYDAEGRWATRVTGSTVRRYLWNELSEYEDVVAETDGNGAPMASYTLGGSDLIQQIGNGNLNAAYFLRDGLGSVIGLTDPTGAQTDRYRYDAWGNRTLASGITANNYLYRSQRTEDISGLLYLRTRYLNTGIGRFITRDTAAFDLDNPVDLNRYRYAASNPINDYDPTGYQDAAEYGMLANEEAQNAEIEGYLVGRRDETWISCMAMLLSAMFARIMEDQIWKGLKNKVVFAFGHVVKAPLDAIGKDYEFSPADPEGRKVLLAKAAMFKAASREEAVATNGTFKISRQIQDIINNFTGRFKFVGGTGTGSADPCANHAELKIKAYENPPTNTIESIAASIPVCVNCHLQLYPYVECIVPFGTNTRCLKGPILGQ